MAPEPNDLQAVKVIEGQQTPVEAPDDRNKSPRHPRWTRQETLVLIEGKKIVENRGRKGRRSSSVFRSDQVEPKWDTISSYCKQNGVNRGPVQSRKRWSNLLGDFKKIKAWESQVKEESDSFWMMRNDIKREKKLPGFFDSEVFDVLDGRAFTATAYQLALVTISADAKDGDGAEAVNGEDEEEEEEEVKAIFDSGRHAGMEDGLFSDFEQLAQKEIGRSPDKDKVSTEFSTRAIPSPVPISEKHLPPFPPGFIDQGTRKGKHAGSRFWGGAASQEGCKRRRMSDGCEDANVEDCLIKVLEKNTNILKARLESQNMNRQLDREQPKDYNDNLVAALDRITDALTKIADKL